MNEALEAYPVDMLDLCGPISEEEQEGRYCRFLYLTHLGLKLLDALTIKKIAHIQAHSAAPSAALRACRSAIFEKVVKMCENL